MKIHKKRKDSEIERLERENRELKSLNRSLMKRLKNLDKGFKEQEENSKNDETPNVYKDVTHLCPECHKGYLYTATVANRQFSRCELCNYRTRAKKI